MLLALILAQFPIELPPGGLTFVSGEAARVVYDRGAFIVVWADDRRAWLQSEKPESLFAATVVMDGGAPVVSRIEELALGDFSPGELSVSVGANGELLAAWLEEPVSNELWRLHWAIRRGAQVSTAANAGWTDVTSSVTSAWAGPHAAIAVARMTETSLLWLDGGAAPLTYSTVAGLMGTRSISASATNTGDINFAATTGARWETGTLVPTSSGPVFVASDGGSAATLFSHVLLEPLGRALLLRRDTQLAVLHEGRLLDAGAPGLFLPPLSLGYLSARAQFAVGTRVASAPGVIWLELDGGVRSTSFPNASELFVAAGPDLALAAVARAPSGVLDLLAGSGAFAGPVPLGVRPAPLRSLTLAAAGADWVVGWEERVDGVSQTRLQVVEANAALGSATRLLNATRPWLQPSPVDGGMRVSLVSTTAGGNTTIVQSVNVPTLTSSNAWSGPLTASQGALALADGVFGWSRGAWTFSSPTSPKTLPPFPGSFQLTPGAGVLGDVVWVLARETMPDRLRLLVVTPSPPAPGGGIISQSATFDNSSSTPTFASVAPRRRADGSLAALVGYAESDSQATRWAIVSLDGGVTTLATMDAGTRFVAVARPSGWLRVLSSFSAGPSGPGRGLGRLWAEEVLDDGGVSSSTPMWVGPWPVGTPVASVNGVGEVGVAWPLLEDGMPKVQFSVLFGRDSGVNVRDAGLQANDAGQVDAGQIGPVPDGGVIDAGVTRDAGATIDGGTPDDGGTASDAGTPGDAGTSGDAGLPRDDGGVVDGGDATDGGEPRADAGSGPPDPLLFAPIACGCSQGEAPAWLVGVLGWAMARRARRKKQASA